MNETATRRLQEMDSLATSGFAIALHIRFTTPDLLLQTYPKSWIDLYSERGYVMSDPTVRWGFDNTGAIRWSDLADDDPKGVFPAAREHGLACGISIATETGGSKSFASFARDDREFTEDEIATLTRDMEALHQQTAAASGISAQMRDALVQMTRSLARPRAEQH